MEKTIRSLRDRYAGQDNWFIASGPSAGYIEPSFFDNKIAIGVNETYHRFPNQKYIVRKDFVKAMQAYQTGIPLVISRHDCASHRNSKPMPLPDDGAFDYYVFDHEHNGRTEIYLSVIGTDRLVVSFSTITTAMHLAAYMGAANVILVGHDCGTIDGEKNMAGYHDPTSGEKFYADFLAQIEPQTLAVRDRLAEVYGCKVYSLNPWVNLGMEGHEYRKAGPQSTATADVIGDVGFRVAKREYERVNR